MSALTGLSMRTRLLLTLGLALALVVATALLALSQMRRQSQAADSIYADRLVPLALLRHMEHGLNTPLSTLLAQSASSPDARALDPASRQMAQGLRDDWRQYLGTRMVPPESALIRRAQPHLERLWLLLDNLAQSTPADLRELQQRRQAVLRVLDDLIAFQLDQARHETDASREATGDAARLSLLLVALTAAVCALMVWTIWARYDEERRAGLASRERLQQLYIALSQTNQLIVRGLEDEAALFAGLCRICVDTGHARLATVVLRDGNEFVRAAIHGPAERLMPGAPQRWRADAPFAQSSMSTRAILAGTHQLSNRPLQDPTLARAGAPLIPPGVEAMAAFPLRRGGQVVGALSLLAGEPDFFDDDVMRLLDEMVGDLSYALANLQRHHERDAALAEAQQARDHWRQRFEAMAAARVAADARAETGANPQAKPGTLPPQGDNPAG